MPDERTGVIEELRGRKYTLEVLAQAAANVEADLKEELLADPTPERAADLIFAQGATEALETALEIVDFDEPDAGPESLQALLRDIIVVVVGEDEEAPPTTDLTV